MTNEFNVALFAFVRASAFLLVLPVFSATSVPVALRTAIAAMLAFIVSPTLPVPPIYPGLLGAIGSLLSEALVGFALGFTGRLVFGSFEIGGQLITTEIGLNMSSVLNPMSSTPTQAPAMMLFLLGATLLFGLDLHHWIITGFVRSFSIVPIGGAGLHHGFLDHMVIRSTSMFVVAVQMATPIMAVSFVVSVIFSILGRAVPQMSVFTESFIFRTAAGLTVFGFTLPLVAQHMANAMRRIPDDLVRISQWLGFP